MDENKLEGQDRTASSDVDAARAHFENERLTRRQALRKFGFMAGMAAFATVSVDDLARVAAKKLQENEMTKGIGDTLATEFRAAGVSLATPIGGNPYGLPDGYYVVNPPVPRDPCKVGANGGVPNCDECNDYQYLKCVKKKGYLGAGACKNIATECEAACTGVGDANGAAAIAACWAIAMA